jgi:pimeloyl-ACP methyl ester carboxylesterase
MLSLYALSLVLSAQEQDPDYRQPANWLCRPGHNEACEQNLDTTVIAADGTRRIERFAAAKAPKFDCFYVYPTISNDPGGNSDLVPGPEERRVVQFQAARFAAKCRLFAPMYRQVTLTALRSMIGGATPAIDRDLAYRDVKAAWGDYLAHDNQGRGVVLIGHSQGSLILTQLLKREIDGKPAANRMISAMLIGSSVPVPEGKDVGGLYNTIPLCRSGTQSGCIVTYASFRADSPPPADSRFGKGDRPGVEAGCTNPAALAGGKAVSQPYLAATGSMLGEGPSPPWTSDGKPVTTPFVRAPGLLSTECVRRDGFNYLAVTVNADPADPRTDKIAGDVVAGTQILKNWGLHLIDMNVAQGDLVALAETQATAWAARRRAH